MKNKYFATVVLLIFTELAAFYVILAYSTSDWLVKVIWLMLFAVVGIIYWVLMDKKTKSTTLSGGAEWAQIQHLLKDIATTNTYVLQLDDAGQLDMPVVSVRNDATYIVVYNPEHLVNIAVNLFNHSAGKTLAFGAELSVYPTLQTDTAARLKDWLRNILFLQKRLGFVVPVNLVMHAPSNLFDSSSVENARWLVLKLKERCTESDVNQLLEIFQQLLAEQFRQNEGKLAHRDYLRASYAVECLKTLFSQHADLGWAYVNIRSLSVVSDAPVKQASIWQKFIANTTGRLIWPESEKHIQSSSPVALISKDSFFRQNIIVETGFKILSVATLAFGVAALLSTFNNQRLLKRVQQHIEEVRTSTHQSVAVQEQAKKMLQQDLNLLNKYRLEGEPSWFGLGLYRADRLIPEIERTLLEKEPPPAKDNPETKAVVLTLDSLALFETGQFELKNNANKALIGVLRAIETHPNTQILVEGHTDNVGTQQANQQLSEKRAIAVRDWLVVSSNLAVTRFAVKGYGDTRPIDSNETEKGRAKNRRVEIILIPDKIMPSK